MTRGGGVFVGLLRGTAAVLGCELRGVLAPAIGTGGETPPELAGEDACGTGAVRGRAPRFSHIPKFIFEIEGLPAKLPA